MEVVYLETSIVSHATSLPSRNSEIAVLQEQARRWMLQHSQDYQLVTSQYVISEAGLGDPVAAARRLELLRDVQLLEYTPAVDQLAQKFVQRSLIPPNALIDALHVAIAALAGVQYLLTQNCSHIANARTLPGVYALLQELNLTGLLIATPAQFLGEPGEPHD
jgi:hypothetical protein